MSDSNLPEDRALSDEEVNELYRKLKGKEKSPSLLAKLKDSADSVVKKTTDAIEDLEDDAKPFLGKIADQTKDELEDFSKDSSSGLKNAGKSLKGFGNKFLGKTRNELEDGTNFLKEKSPDAAEKFKDGLEKTGDSLKKSLPKAGKSTKNSFIDTVEKLYGAKTVGRQYGAQSIQLLRELGELRESGLITEKDYLEKKREILERI